MGRSAEIEARGGGACSRVRLDKVYRNDDNNGLSRIGDINDETGT